MKTQSQEVGIKNDFAKELLLIIVKMTPAAFSTVLIKTIKRHCCKYVKRQKDEVFAWIVS